ncbi:hypothetical protein [Tenggerimyces flavus]|uniref:Uncharacterized protein n=1 Tax=Tenggerimyces flavus TaxID=1708749 RepID=A0ABV7YSL0_9ACTN|nr:hypothetical protein [Tenggerimyces flavus]MBM7784472.1 hypothetical protein [Tenggerimyces flavus]
MSESTATTLPVHGEVFIDARGGDRSLRVSWHPDAGVAVLSIWRDSVCVASLRMRARDVPVLIDVLSAGLGADRLAMPEDEDQPRGRHAG